MSLQLSMIVIEGDARKSLPDFFLRCGYLLPEGRIDKVQDLEDAVAAIEEAETKAVCVCGTWTVVLDGELVLSEEEEALAELSATTRVIVLTADGLSDVYGYALYSKGEKVRELVYAEGQVSEDFGLPLEVEEGLSLQGDGEDAVLSFGEAIGFSFESLQKAKTFELHDIVYDDDDDDDDYDEDDAEDEDDELDEAEYRMGNAGSAGA